jgi:hypothetical protein
MTVVSRQTMANHWRPLLEARRDWSEPGANATELELDAVQLEVQALA